MCSACKMELWKLFILKVIVLLYVKSRHCFFWSCYLLGLWFFPPCMFLQRFLKVPGIEKGLPMCTLVWTTESALKRSRRESGIKITQKTRASLSSLLANKCMNFNLIIIPVFGFKKVAYSFGNLYSWITDITVPDCRSASKDLYAFLLPQFTCPSAQLFSQPANAYWGPGESKLSSGQHWD